MAIVEKFNKFIDEVNEADHSSIPHGISILDCFNSYMVGKSLIDTKFHSVDDALYMLATEVEDPGSAATAQIAALNEEINGTIDGINTYLEPAEDYTTLATAVAALEDSIDTLKAGDSAAILAINTALDPAEPYTTLAAAVAGIIAAYEELANTETVGN